MSYNDYSLLRPFDLEAAKRGEPICMADGESAKFLAHEPKHPYLKDWGVIVICSRGITTYSEKGLRWRDEPSSHDLRMAPLCWVEGKPVYKGDKLWHKYNEKFRTYHHMNAEGYLCQKGEGTGDSLSNLTWEIPKKQIKMLAYIDASGWLIWRKEGIEITPSHGVVRVTSEDKIVEVE